MTELTKLIAEFHATLAKFEAIASRMESRIAESDPVDPISDFPPFPPLPEGFARWAYRGVGWKSKERVCFASYGRFDTDWVTFPFGCTVGYESTHYIEAVKDVTGVPEVAVPFPPIPEGYSRWAYRGVGWTSMDPVKYAYWMHPFKTWVVLNDSIPVGIKNNHYIEAVKDPA